MRVRRSVLAVIGAVLIGSGAIACTPGPLPLPPPIVLLPDYFEVDAHDWAGTTVTWPDPVVVSSPQPFTTVECESASGDFFSIGSHIIECDAVSGPTWRVSVGTFSFLVLPGEDLPPVLQLPEAMNVGVDDPAGGVVTWTVDGYYGDYTPITPTCSPSSGSVLPIGVTTVECSATSPFGDTTVGEFEIDVVPPIAEPVDEATGCRIGTDQVVRCEEVDPSVPGDPPMRTIPFSGPVDKVSGANILNPFNGVRLRHLCALLVGGTVECVGLNTWGQLGDGTNLYAETPVAVVGISNAVDVRVAEGVSCALLADGSVRCWGGNDNGQLGNGTTTASNVPVPVSGITSAVSLDVAGKGFGEFDAHACVALVDGSTWCWGANGNSQLANGGPGDSSLPTPVLNVSDSVQVSAGGMNGCALDSVGTVRCWGDNFRGQLGDGTFDPFSSPQPVVAIGPAVSIATSLANSCALLADQTVWCWGVVDGYTATPVQVAGVGAVEEIWTMPGRACALTVGGEVWCWTNSANAALIVN